MSSSRDHALVGVSVHAWSMKPPVRGLDLDEPTLDQMPRPRRARAEAPARESDIESFARDVDDDAFDLDGPWLTEAPRPARRRGVSPTSVMLALTLALTGAALGFTGARAHVVKNALPHHLAP